MPRNGSGVFTVFTPGNPVVTGTVISSTVHNNTMNDIATALTQSISSTGETPISANLPMSGFKHTGVGNATARTEYAAAGQAQDSSFMWGGTAGGTADALTITLTPAITAYAAGQRFTFISGAAGNATTTPTLNVNGVGAKTIVKRDNTALGVGDITVSTLIDVEYDGTNFRLVPPIVSNSIQRSARTSNTILGVADKSKLIDITSGSFTQTVTAAATLGDGWFCYYRNAGTGIVTIDPNGAETIGGLATLVLTIGMSILLQSDGVNLNYVNLSGVGNHSVTVTNGNGSGSTNTKIRRFTTTQTNVGTAITYADSATLGASFTINEPGIYEAFYEDESSLGQTYIGISVNTTQPTVDINSITATDRAGLASNATNITASLTRVLRLSTGDVVRPHWGSSAPNNTNAAFSAFSIKKVNI